MLTPSQQLKTHKRCATKYLLISSYTYSRERLTKLNVFNVLSDGDA